MNRNDDLIRSTIAETIDNISQMSPSDVYVVYGIILNNDGTVIDRLSELKYESVSEWAQYYSIDMFSNKEKSETTSLLNA